ncbi:hypothetical protein KCP69_22420 [Salmonella enterica subsp. enterica]|nr:hypothetical protein KCP69_22420 [Salmonella enterica subsp. enterica]
MKTRESPRYCSGLITIHARCAALLYCQRVSLIRLLMTAACCTRHYRRNSAALRMVVKCIPARCTPSALFRE